MSKNVLAAAAVLLGLAGVASADVWVETGDAGALAPGQETVGSGPLTSILGVLEGNNARGADFEDVYCIRITDPMNFRATTIGGAAFDTQLSLFDAMGNGIAFNDDSSGLQSLITNAFTAALPAGVFALAISGFDHDGLDAGGLEIFADTPFGGERGPTAGRGPLASWGGIGSIGTYSITLVGAEFCNIPTPGAAALAGLGGLALLKRRRNK